MIENQLKVFEPLLEINSEIERVYYSRDWNPKNTKDTELR